MKGDLPARLWRMPMEEEKGQQRLDPWCVQSMHWRCTSVQAERAEKLDVQGRMLHCDSPEQTVGPGARPDP